MAEINKPSTKGLKHIIDAGGYSLLGLKAALTFEEAFRLAAMAFVGLAPLALWLGDGAIERVLLLGSLFIVLITELLNSALETLVDRVSTDHHTLSGRAKDIGSAAVFMALMNVLATWGIILWERVA